jgi:hypothetical protein
MFLIDWLSANIMMVFVVLILIGIPVAIGLTVFSKKKDSGEEGM